MLTMKNLLSVRHEMRETRYGLFPKPSDIDRFADLTVPKPSATKWGGRWSQGSRCNESNAIKRSVYSLHHLLQSNVSPESLAAAVRMFIC